MGGGEGVTKCRWQSDLFFEDWWSEVAGTLQWAEYSWT